MFFDCTHFNELITIKRKIKIRELNKWLNLEKSPAIYSTGHGALMIFEFYLIWFWTIRLFLNWYNHF